MTSGYVTDAAVQQARIELAARLRSRSREIEEAVVNRVKALDDGWAKYGPEYAEGLRATVVETVAYALSAIEHGADWNTPVPLAAAAQARLAARVGVSLDIVLRRYAAGDRVVGVFIVDEAEDIPRNIRQQIQRAQSPPVDRLMAAVAQEYRREAARIDRSPMSRLQARVRRVLAGDVEVGVDLGYELAASHVAVITDDAGDEEGIRSVGKRLDCQILFVEGDEGVGWAWLGRRRPIIGDEVECELERLALARGSCFSLGEPRSGVAGWRLTHREAQTIREVKADRPPGTVRSREVMLAVAVLSNRTFTESLLASYLDPLDSGRGESGTDLRKTLREYFAAGQIASTAAAALKVDRRTVRSRLRSIEERLGQRIEDCHAELQVALKVEEILSVNDIVRTG